MKKLILALLLVLLSVSLVLAQPGPRPGLLVDETDGNPSTTYVYKLRFAPGALSVSDAIGTVASGTPGADSIDDTMIDWGTGAGEVGIDDLDLNEGQMIVGDSGNKAAATSTIPNLSISAFPATDDTWSGIAISGTAGYATAQWDVVFLDSVSDNNKFEKADANESGDFPAWGLATAAVAENAALVVIVKGCIRNDGWNGTFTHGDLLYLDETTAGGLVASASAPDTSGDCVQPIGYFFDKGSDTYLCIDVNPVSGWATVP